MLEDKGQISVLSYDKAVINLLVMMPSCPCLGDMKNPEEAMKTKGRLFGGTVSSDMASVGWTKIDKVSEGAS